MKLNYAPYSNKTARNPINGVLYFIQDWFAVCNGNNLDAVQFSQIVGLPDTPYDESRVLKCDIRYPGILWRDEDQLKIIDGRHRVYRLKELGAKEGMFFVLNRQNLHDLTNRPVTSDYLRYKL